MRFFPKQNENYNDRNVQISTEKLISNSSKILDKFGWFQIRCFIFLSFTGFGLGAFSMSLIFLNIVPPFQCGQKQESISQDNFSLNFDDRFSASNTSINDQCTRFVFISNGTLKIQENQTRSKVDFKILSCLDSLIFNISNGNTLVSQFGLVCESAWMRPFTTAFTMIGMFFGTLLGVRLADRLGRRRSGILIVLLDITLLFGIAFSNYYWLYAIMSIINGAMNIMTYITFYTWLLEIAGKPRKRVLAAFSFNAAFGLGGITMSLIAHLAQDWNWIYIVEGIIFTICLVFCWFVPESAPWLLQKQKFDEAAKLLQIINKTNQVDFDFNTNDSALQRLKSKSEIQKSKPETENLDGIMLLKNKVLRRRLICICLIWNVVILSFYTNSLNVANLGGSAYVNNVIGNGLEIVALAATTYALKNRGRRTTLAISMICFGFLIILSPLAKQSNEIAGICLAMVARFFAMSVSMISFLYSGELFPTMLRSTSICICSTLSRISGILTPFLVFAGEEVDLSIPFYVMGGIAFVAVYLVLLLPETSNSPLLNTLEDALALKDPSLLPHCNVYSKTKKNNDRKTSNKQLMNEHV